jgi:hypothetical protein
MVANARDIGAMYGWTYGEREVPRDKQKAKRAKRNEENMCVCLTLPW